MELSDIRTIDYHGKPLRVVFKDGEPWFIVPDLCRILNIYMRPGKPVTKEAMRRLRPSTKGHHVVETSCGPRVMGIVNRDGAHDLAFRAKHPNATELFVFDTSNAMVSGRHERVAANA